MPSSVFHSSITPLGLTASAEGGLPAATTALNFTMQRQLQTQWCWAAVTSSVAAFYGNKTWKQCRIVTEELGELSCCANGSSATCNRPWLLDKALTRAGLLAAFTAKILSPQQITSEIQAGRALGVRVGWTGGGGHFLVVAGCSAQSVLDVFDPWFGRSSVNYFTFRTAYQGTGRWTHSYQTQPQGTKHAAATKCAAAARV